MSLNAIPWAPAETRLETVPCPVCGNMDFRFLRKASNLHLNPALFTRKGYAPYPMHSEESSIVACRTCGLVQLNPRRVSADLIGLNNALHLVKDYKDGNVESGEVLTGEGDRALREERMRGILRFKSSGRFLDVGCGAGRDLDLAVEHGFEAYGVELSEVKKDFYKNKNFKVHVGAFEDAPFPEKYFDVITMWDVLEHVENPNRVLAKVRSLLKPDGLFVAKVPNHAAWNRLVHGKNWDMYHPLHLYYFTRRTLAPLLQKHGLGIVRAISVNPYGLGCLLKDMLNSRDTHRNPNSWLARTGYSFSGTGGSSARAADDRLRSRGSNRPPKNVAGEPSFEPLRQPPAKEHPVLAVALAKSIFRGVDYLPKQICLKSLGGNFLIVYAC